MPLTSNEVEFLTQIALSEFTAVNGAEPHHAEDTDTWLWLDEIGDNLGLSVQSSKGVYRSLLKKRMLKQTGGDGQGELSCMLTEDGLKAWKLEYYKLSGVGYDHKN